ncbi:unnamed protein product, partial [Onchocerca ochengi]|uniref:Ovate family protein n=1 Tax=Onchocerca ochengi TaxID=42157 RepID=A0A182EQ01_ONCOC
MLPFIGSITSNCCSILSTVREKTSQEDLEGGILTIVGLRIANRNNPIRRKESQTSEDLRSLDVFDTDNLDSKMIQSTDDNPPFRKMNLARSAESVYPFFSEHLQSSSSSISMRRPLSHHIDRKRSRSLMWVRSTTEEIMARVSSRASDHPKFMQFDLTK